MSNLKIYFKSLLLYVNDAKINTNP